MPKLDSQSGLGAWVFGRNDAFGTILVHGRRICVRKLLLLVGEKPTLKTFRYGAILFFSSSIPDPGHVLVVVNTVITGAYFLAVLGPHIHGLNKARAAAAVVYEVIDRVRSPL